MTEQRAVADIMRRKLMFHMGPHISRIAVRVCFEKASVNPERIADSDLPKLIDALRPMLSVMLGQAAGKVVLDEIARDVGAQA